MGQATIMGSGSDVISFIKMQHQQIKQMFEQVLQVQGEDREAQFVQLRRLLAIHETAEEEIVHPAARKSITDGEAIISARLAEEQKAKTALVALEKLDVRSPEFVAKFRELQTDVIAHAEAEEKLELTQLGANLDPARLQKMGKAAELAESIAPTRPHPSLESPAANILAGPFVAMVDRVRDAITSPAAGHLDRS